MSQKTAGVVGLEAKLCQSVRQIVTKCTSEEIVPLPGSERADGRVIVVTWCSAVLYGLSRGWTASKQEREQEDY